MTRNFYPNPSTSFSNYWHEHIDRRTNRKHQWASDDWRRIYRWVRCSSAILSSSSSVWVGAKRTRLMYSMPGPCSSASYSPSWETQAYDPSSARVTNEQGSLYADNIDS